MALFSKPPAKKPAAPPPDAPPAGAIRSRPPSARDAMRSTARAQAEPPKIDPVGPDTVTGSSLVDWSPSQPAIEVAQANPGLCGVLENAALLFASGQLPAARVALEQGVVSDPEARASPLAWLALFDLLQRSGDRAAFDQFSLQYVVEFERSPPAWEERAVKPAVGPRAAVGGFLAVSGVLSAASATQVEGLRRAIDRQVPQARLDFASVTGFDDAGARLLADALAEARRRRFALTLQRPEKLRTMVDAATKKGVEGGEGAWLLALELMQWAHDQTSFDERAIDYAVAFEMSPPSWEPPPKPAEPAETDAGAAAAAAARRAGDDETLSLSGVIVGNATDALARIAEHAQRRSVVAIDLAGIERIDFVCAGALLNAITRIESQRKSVQIAGASPIVRALLLLIGISPRHFVRKAA